jgi:hypothetical protein
VIFGYPLAEVRKALVTLAGVITTLLAANLLPGSWAHYASIAAGILTVVGTYSIPNAAPAALGRHEAANPPDPNAVPLEGRRMSEEGNG